LTLGWRCVGEHFATIKVKFILASLIQAFSFQIAASQRDADFTFTSFVTMKTKLPDFKVCVKSRE
jgi:cytochrome P450